MIYSLVVAADENYVIGKDNKLPWHLSSDLKHFKQITQNGIIVMGRKTYESIGQALPNRRNVIISRTFQSAPQNTELFHSLGEALMSLSSQFSNEPNKEVFIIGGGELFNQILLDAMLKFTADRIYFTRVHTKIEGGDVFFPEIKNEEWKVVSQEAHPADEKNEFPFTFFVYERKK